MVFFKDLELDETKLSFAFSPSFDKLLGERLNLLSWLPLNRNVNCAKEATNVLDSESLFYLPGSGIASKLFDRLTSSESKFLVCLINHYTSEGDNSGDAFYVVEQLDDWLRLTDKTDRLFKWLPPVSWSMLFGSDPRRSLY